MNLELQRRRLMITMAITTGSLIMALVAAIASLGFHLTWGAWLFGAAIAVGFASHGWLMLGVLLQKPAP